MGNFYRWMMRLSFLASYGLIIFFLTFGGKYEEYLGLICKSSALFFALACAFALFLNLEREYFFDELDEKVMRTFFKVTFLPSVLIAGFILIFDNLPLSREEAGSLLLLSLFTMGINVPIPFIVGMPWAVNVDVVNDEYELPPQTRRRSRSERR